MRLITFRSTAISTICLAALSSAAAAQNAPPAAPACVALTLPSVQGVEDATSFGAGVRDLFASFLNGPSVKTTVLEARLPSQAALEARNKGCGQVLLVAVSRKRSSGNGVGGVLGQAAGIAVMRTPVAGGVAGSVASGATWAGGEAMYRFASQTRAKDEIELSYRFGAPDAVERARAVSSKAKAARDGEDLLTPLIEKAADRIVTAATAGGR
jgi:hypothetical protein